VNPIEQALATVSNTEAGEDAVYDALALLRSETERLRGIERAALDVVRAAQSDPPAKRYLVPGGTFDVMRRRLEPIYR
jgi:hypothetical protein